MRIKNEQFKTENNFSGQWSLCYFILTILLSQTFSSDVTSSSTNIIKVGLVVENEASRDLSNYFSIIIADYNQNASDDSIRLQGFVLNWDAKKPPVYNLKLVEHDIIQENLTFVLSLLDYEKNDVLCDLVRNSRLVLVNLRDECYRLTSEVCFLPFFYLKDLILLACKTAHSSMLKISMTH